MAGKKGKDGGVGKAKGFNVGGRSSSAKPKPMNQKGSKGK